MSRPLINFRSHLDHRPLGCPESVWMASSSLVCGDHAWVRHIKALNQPQGSYPLDSRRPLIGGGLSNAGTKWPQTFGKFGYLVDHPYFLPCATVGSIAFVSYLYAWCFLREVTLIFLDGFGIDDPYPSSKLEFKFAIEANGNSRNEQRKSF